MLYDGIGRFAFKPDGPNREKFPAPVGGGGGGFAGGGCVGGSDTGGWALGAPIKGGPLLIPGAGGPPGLNIIGGGARNLGGPEGKDASGIPIWLLEALLVGGRAAN